MNRSLAKRIVSLCIAASAAAAVWAVPLTATAESAGGGTVGRYYIDAQSGFLMDINRNTTIADFKAAFPNAQVQIFSGETEQTEGYVATGYTVRITQAEQTDEYAAVIHGDVDGDGRVSITDVMETCKLLAQSTSGQPPVYNAAFCAAGVEGYLADGNMAQSVTITDVMTLCKHIASGASIRYSPRIKGDGLALSAVSLELSVGQTQQLTAALPDPAAQPLVTWSTDRPDILSVSPRGAVTALATGQATVTAACREVTATCIVEVTGVPADLESGSYDLQAVSTQQFLQMTEAGGLTLVPAEDSASHTFRLEASENGYIIRAAADEAYTLE